MVDTFDMVPRIVPSIYIVQTMSDERVDELWLFVNGRKVSVPEPDPEVSLLQFLRVQLRLTGSKNGCTQGGCGACTVMVSWFDSTVKKIRHKTVNSCITPICSVYGFAVTTVEGVGNSRTGLHPIQESLVKSHGIQCGFCTPGMVMTLYCLLRNNPRPTQSDVEQALEGNLCRCTGYRPIIDSTKPFTQNTCPLGEKCCKNTTQVMDSVENPLEASSGQFSPCDITQNVIFPPELQKATDQNMKIFRHKEWTWFVPYSLTDLLMAKKQYPESKVIMGATGLSYFIHMGKMSTFTLIDGTRVKELQEITIHDGHLEIGSAVTMTALEEFLQSIEDPKPTAVDALLKCLRWLAAAQIRNAATIGGHVVTADCRSDLNPLLIALGASLTVIDGSGEEKQYKLEETFFPGRFRTVLSPQDVVLKVIVPEFTSSKSSCYIRFYKQSERKGFDYAIANTACRVQTAQNGRIDGATLCVGGVSNKPVVLKKTSKFLLGKNQGSIDVQEVLITIKTEMAEICADKFKQSLVCGFVSKFMASLLQESEDKSFMIEDTLLWTKSCSSMQVIEDVPSDQPEIDPVGRPLPLVTSHSLASGEAQFVDDIPRFKDELYLSPVCSTKAHAKIISVDPSEALAMPGVVGYYDHTSIIGQNKFGVLVKDEELFASEEVLCYGQMLAVIAATSEATARKASRLVKVEYKELNVIITIQDAIRENSFYSYASVPVHTGDVDLAFTQAENIIEGEVNTGSQEHHYMEPISAIAIPKIEDKEIELYVTMQSIMFEMQNVAALLNIPENRVTVKHRRTGGAFGGKETPPFKAAGPAALVAQLTGRPVRFVLDRHSDMIMTGKRHPFLIKYKAGIDKEGHISAVDIELFCNAGYSLDISQLVLDTTLGNMDGCYNIPNFRVKGHLCCTNTPSNTAFRAFGVPQGLVGLETMIHHIAKATGKTQEEIRLKHLYKENDLSVHKMKMENCNLQKCWDLCYKQAHYEDRRAEVEKFNCENDTVKRGMAMLAIKFPVGFAISFLNQGSALINIYIDGTVRLTHGGCEIGQGINTKMIQVASRCLGIPMEKIYVSHASSEIVPNPTTTGGSSTTDIIGAAVVNGCTELLERLKPFREEEPDISWENLIQKAYFNRVNLGVMGFGTPDGGNWNSQTGSGKICNYYTFGVGCCTVEIDCLTGDHQVLSMDIVMDVGKSLNPAIDIGQIEGGFIMGYGMITVEDMKWTPDGIQISNGPINYKIPGVRNIPREFKVSLLKDCPNPKAVYSSKGIGEPPLLLSVAVYLALKEAITAIRVAKGHSEIFQLDCPVTAERIRMACDVGT